jgi:hypothetical protein
MKRRGCLVLALCACLAACAGAPPVPEFPADHPASPQAEAAPRPPAGEALRGRPAAGAHR